MGGSGLSQITGSGQRTPPFVACEGKLFFGSSGTPDDGSGTFAISAGTFDQ